ncbi:MAG: WD40 repeat domain-containing protein, partial [Planctomycetales bacterium]
PVARFKTDKGLKISAAAFAPKAPLIVSGHADGVVRVWNTKAKGGALEATFSGHDQAVTSVAFSRQGDVLLSAGLDGTLRLWDARTKMERHVLEGHQGPIRDAAFTADGSEAISVGQDGTLRLWNVKTGEQSFQCNPLNRPIAYLAVSPRGRFVRCGSMKDGSLSEVDLTTGVRGFSHRMSAGSIRCAAYSPDGAYGLSGDDRSVSLWRLDSPRPLARYDGHAGGVTSVAFSPDGRFALSAGMDGTVRLWPTTPRVQAAARGRRLELIGHRARVRATAYSPNGAWLATADSSGETRLWNARTGRLEQKFKAHADGVGAIAFHPRNGELVSGGGDRQIKFWGGDQSGPRKTLTRHEAPVTALAFSSDGARMASGDASGVLLVWDPEQGEALWTQQLKEGVAAVAFSPNGRLLATGQTGQEREAIAAWNAETGSLEFELEANGRKPSARSLLFVSDSVLVSAGNDGRAVGWDLSRQAELFVLKPPGGVHGLALSPDRKMLLTSGKRLHLWTVADGKPRGFFEATEDDHLSAAISPNGSFIACGGDSQLVTIRPISAATKPVPPKPIPPKKKKKDDKGKNGGDKKDDKSKGKKPPAKNKKEDDHDGKGPAPDAPR